MGTRLSDCAQNYLSEVALSGKPRSLESAQRAMDRLLSILGDIPLTELRPQHVRRIKATLKGEGLKNVTINHHLKYLGAALRQARAEELVDDFPRIKLMKAPLPEPHALAVVAKGERALEFLERR